MEWDAVHGVVKVSYEGVFGLADRNGTEIVPLQYDWMGYTDNSLILVRDEAAFCAHHKRVFGFRQQFERV